MNDITGWRSRLHVALQIKRRVVLHGNVLDDILVEDGNMLPLVPWLAGELQQRGFERVIDYDHISMPEALLGGLPEVFAQLSEDLRNRYARDPAEILDRLRRVLAADTGPRTAVIVRNAESALAASGRPISLLLNLGQDGRRPVGNQNLEIHLYKSEGGIPMDFLRADPEAEAILVPQPRFDERLAYFRSLRVDDRIRQIQEEGMPVEPDRLARVTEGFRLAEVRQLARLGEHFEAGGELRELLNEFRFGRRQDNFKDIHIGKVDERLRRALRGQDSAISQVVDNLYIAKHKVAGIVFEKSSRLPALVLFFVGATGVGKTLMARSICEAVTGTVENLKIFDMTEYQQDHTVQRFIGPPPGYVGYTEGGQLTNWVRERPYSVVLIDEVEKAHERILDIFMQILEGARLTDGRGMTVDFSETILIFTSNIGATEADGLDAANRTMVENYFRQQVEDYFKDYLERPELFNRMKQGGIVVFDFISEAAAREVVKEKLGQIAGEINEKLKKTQSSAEMVLGDDLGHAEIIENILRLSRYQEYGLRSVNNEIMQRAGAGIGKFLDEPRPGRYRFRWKAGLEKVAIERVS